MRVLAIGHSASRSGSPLVFRNVVFWLRQHTDWTIDVVFREGGPLLEEFGDARLLAVKPREFVDTSGYDVIYANSTPALRSFRRASAPVVLHMHEMRFAARVTLGEDWRDRLRSVARFVVPANAVAEVLTTEVGVAADRISIAPGIIDVTARELAAPVDPPLVLGCGTVEWRKGVDLFIQLARHHRDTCAESVRFAWLGAGSPVQEQAMQWEIDKAGAPVTLLGPVSDPWPRYAECAVLAVTSREDPLPLVALEAGLAARPVLCFEQAGDVARLARSGAGIAVPYLDVPAMSAALDGLLSDAEQRAAMGAVGRRLVTQTCSIENGATTIAQVLATTAAAGMGG